MAEGVRKLGALVWDLPTRLFHWLLALLILAAFLSDDNRDIHQRIGIAILALVLFRLIWGVIGGRYARFTSFLRGPKAVLEHLDEMRQPNPPQHVGHNAAGGWMVAVLLVLILAQAGTGLFTNDLITYVGPLGELVAESTSEKITTIHKIMSNLILAAVVLHIGAVLVYFVWKKQNLVRPMLTGRRADLRDADLPPLPDRAPPLWRAGIAAAVAIAVVVGILSLGR
ncbi:cytochrome b/b6 domain-containing protein [Elstera cyanobacteriorum]|uniref:cytochrome b/b6 domain-containing protein n=1 Tax=Elstera cyanobacteriorum TaxID=2022747 RepID=UPI0023538BB2|nr:cytochrome b/b6 domain-containing protein [Elstera cyanobacteriorum]MCK6441837.1 cytochrome b/b6 domain-containing protein [Elstera cyanobacteriorum]